MKIKACVNSGFCCTRAPCIFGQWNDDRTQCEFLLWNDDRSSCGKYEEISKDPSSTVSPAFGAGCCSSLFNYPRAKIIERHYKGQEQLIEVNWSYE